MQPGGRLVGLPFAIALPGQPLVVVVDRHRQHLLGFVLPHHLLIQEALDLLGFGNLGQGRRRFGGFLRLGLAAGFRAGTAAVAVAIHQFFVEDFVAEIDALVADVDAWSSDQLADLLLGLATEGAFEVGVELGHRRRVGRRGSGQGQQPIPRINLKSVAFVLLKDLNGDGPAPGRRLPGREVRPRPGGRCR